MTMSQHRTICQHGQNYSSSASNPRRTCFVKSRACQKKCFKNFKRFDLAPIRMHSSRKPASDIILRLFFSSPSAPTHHRDHVTNSNALGSSWKCVPIVTFDLLVHVKICQPPPFCQTIWLALLSVNSVSASCPYSDCKHCVVCVAYASSYLLTCSSVECDNRRNHGCCCCLSPSLSYHLSDRCPVSPAQGYKKQQYDSRRQTRILSLSYGL